MTWNRLDEVVEDDHLFCFVLGFFLPAPDLKAVNNFLKSICRDWRYSSAQIYPFCVMLNYNLTYCDFRNNALRSTLFLLKIGALRQDLLKAAWTNLRGPT